MNITLKEAARIAQCETAGDENFVLRQLCALDEPKEDGICYLTHLEKPELLQNLKAGCVILPLEAKGKELPFKGNILYAQNPE